MEVGVGGELCRAMWLHDLPVKAPEQEQKGHSEQNWIVSQGTKDTTQRKVLTGEMTLI